MADRSAYTDADIERIIAATGGVPDAIVPAGALLDDGIDERRPR